MAVYPTEMLNNRLEQSQPFEYSESAKSLITNGYCKLKIPECLQKRFWFLVSAYADIEPDTKAEFSFPGRTDGLLPFGMERSRVTSQVDLCERFCFRHKYRLDHSLHPFSLSPIYAAALGCESLLSAIAEHLMEAISSAFNTVDSIAIRDSSYMQFCSYAPRFRRIDREYLQDRHEDGNLITLVKASSEGLILFPDGLPQKVSTVDDEIVVFTGSLLSILSDGRIPTMDHAVVNPTANTGRSSLVYFALPDLQRTYTSFVCGNGINLETTANELHRGFGNQPFRDTAS